MSNTQKIFQDSILWVRIAICANTHIKRALLNVVHNTINHPQVTGIPPDPKDLFMFLQTKKNIIKSAKHLKKEQKSILLPTSSQSVDSSLLDISLIRWLIQTFNNITNASGNWQEPLQTDQTICANVYRAANMRNKIFHYDDVETLDEKTFEILWKEMKYILNGLNYTEDIEPMRTETLDITKMQGEMLKEFQDHLEDYKKVISKEPSPECYIQRHFSVDKDKNDIVSCTELDKLINESDQVNIFANAGVGKSVTARNMKCQWGKEEILTDFFLLYFDSKQINQHIRHNSFSAPLFFSELGYHLRKKGRTERNFKYFDCVRTTIANLIIIIDGIDEFPIKNLVIGNYVNELEDKIKNNEEISAADTIIAIYFKFLFPYSKICLLGGIGEFEQLKKLKPLHHPTIFSEKNRIIKEMKLLKFDDANVEKFTCLKICKQQLNGQITCTNACKDVYEKIKDIELCKTPTDLNSLIELYKKHPNENIGRITRTKLIIATLFNRLNEHIYQKNCFTLKTFQQICKQKGNYLKCICRLAEISFDIVLKEIVTAQVEEEHDTNGIVYFEYDNKIKVEREIFEELDLFYVRDLDYHFILEPYYTLYIEFLAACFLFSHPNEWDSILKLNKDRQLEIISFIAGLYADDIFTNDFTKNILQVPSNYLIETFFSWLYNVEDLRDRLPNGSDCWFGLMENQKLSPPFFLLDFISNEVEIPQNFIPKTIVCYCGNPYGNDTSFEWYFMKYLKHNFLTKLSDRLNIESFLDKFPSFKFTIKGDIYIRNNDEFNLLDQYNQNDIINFEINALNIWTPLDTSFKSCFTLNKLYIGYKCDSRTIDTILNALASYSTNTSSFIKCKRLRIYDIGQFNGKQTEKLFTLNLSGVVHYISLDSTFLTDKHIDIAWRFYTFFRDDQIDIMENVERKSRNRVTNLELFNAEFNDIFGLPNLGSRHLSLISINNVTDNDVIKLRKHIPRGYSNNLDKYKIISPGVPFVRKENCSQEFKQSLYLNLCDVDFRQVSPKVFGKTFSLIPTLACVDSKDYYGYDQIPSSHWSGLSQREVCRIKEMRIWSPQPKNFEHFLNVKANIMQLIFYRKDELKQLLNHFGNNRNIQLNKKIKIFVLKFDEYDWGYYEELTLFSKKTDDLDDLDNTFNNCVPYHEGKQHLKYWCCEISAQNVDSKNKKQDDSFLKKCFCC